MKIFGHIKLLSCALALFVLTATVHGGASSSSQDTQLESKDPLYLNPPKGNFCCFRYFPNIRSGPLQIIVNYMEDGRNCIFALKGQRLLSHEQKEIFRSLKERLSTNSNATDDEKNRAKKQIAQIYTDSAYLNAQDPQEFLHINVILNDLADFSELQLLGSICRVEGLQNNMPLISHKLTPEDSEFLSLLTPNIQLKEMCSQRVNILKYYWDTVPAKMYLIPLLNILNNLRYLDLSNNNIEKKSAQVLAPALKQLTNLEYLDLGGNYMSHDSALVLVPSLALLTNLKHLGLTNFMSSCYPHDDESITLELILEQVITKLTKLEHLELDGTIINYNMGVTLAFALAKLTNLKYLRLNVSFRGEDSADALARILASLINLNHLSLNIGTRMSIFAPALAKLTKLKYLCLYNWYISTPSLHATQALAQALPHLTKLRELILYMTDLPYNITTLAPALAKLANLKDLHMDYCSYDDEDLDKATAEYIRKTLSHIDGLQLDLPN